MERIRPININPLAYRYPLPAIISILHRVTGLALVILIPFILWFLQYSLTDNGFDNIRSFLSNSWVQILFWLLFIPYCFHLVAGIRHLLMDIDIGISLKGGKLGALLTLIFAAILIILVGIWLW